MSEALAIYTRCARLPFGKALFSKMVCFRAPYFSTIRPRFVELRPGYGELTIKKRRSVQNHLKSVHAIAMCNMCELIGGITLDVTLPSNMRWIPKSMNVEYLKIARTDLRAVCEIPTGGYTEKGEYPVTVLVRDTADVEVVRAVIIMHVSAKK